MDADTSEKTKPLFRGTQIVWYLLGLLEIALAFRFVLKLTAANSAAGFTAFVYALTQPFAAPFIAVFRVTVVEGSVFEWTTLLAMIVYWMVAWAILRLLVMSKPVTTPEAAKKLEKQDE